MGDSRRDLLHRNPAHRFTEDLLKAGVRHLLLGLDYLHSECKLGHTGTAALSRLVDNLTQVDVHPPGIKADNVLQEIADDEIPEGFTKAELETSAPRKFVNGVLVYMSR